MKRNLGILPNSGLKGMDVVMSNLQREILKIEGGTLRGLILAAAFVRRETERNSPITPLDTGNLRASWFTVSTKGRARNVKDKFGSLLKTGNFKGPNAIQMAENHNAVVSGSEALMKSVDGQIMVRMGYTANYAMGVHEAVGQHFHRPQSGPKWFEAAVKRSSWQILKIIADNAQVSK